MISYDPVEIALKNKMIYPTLSALNVAPVLVDEAEELV